MAACTPTGQALEQRESLRFKTEAHAILVCAFLYFGFPEAQMNIPNDLKYTTNDEWIKIEGNVGTVGITDYAQQQLSDIVFVEVIVSVGDSVTKGDTCATIESVKAAADVYMPVSGKIIAVNDSLPATPEAVNSDPYGAAWMVKLELSDPGELKGLMDAAGYEKQTQEKE
jgi:glycine cleavage system H protein